MMDSSKIVFKWWWEGSKKIEKTNDVVYGWHLWWTGKDPPRFDSISYLARKREAKITFMHFLLEYLCTYIHILLCEKAAIPAKGQLISKGLFGILNSSKKQTKKFDLTIMIPQVDLFLFVFGRIWRHQKDISKLTDL